MGVRELLLQAIPDAIVVHAITTEGAWQRERFHIVHAGFGETVIGATTPAEQQYANAVASTLRCELSIAAVTDIERRLWLKLDINSVINPLTALHDCRNGDLLKLPGIDTLIDQLCNEFALVARAENQAFDIADLSAQVLRVMRDTAANRSSMLQDIHARRRSEIEFINGFIVRRAQLHGLFCPQQTLLFDAIKQKEHAYS
jgi:2-dehydropantoate 2-reductase